MLSKNSTVMAEIVVGVSTHQNSSMRTFSGPDVFEGMSYVTVSLNVFVYCYAFNRRV